jgi:hypothetical protein
MAFFSDLLGSLTGGDILKGITTIGGAIIGGNANQSAADDRIAANNAALDKQLEFSREGRAEMRAAADRGLASIRAGTQKYADTTAPLRTERPVVMPTYRGLTTQQQIGLNDLRRDDDARLAATGMRGAGRAGIGAVLDRDARFMAGARDRNDQDTLGAKRAARSSADAATANLGQIYAQQGGAEANTELQVGNNIGSTLRSDGAVAGQTIRDSGATGAAADLGNAQLYTSAINSLGGIFAGANREKPLYQTRAEA